MRLWSTLGLLVIAASPLQAEVEIHLSGERVSLRAVSAPVSQILDDLARRTGMKVIYDAQPPRQAMTATLEDRIPNLVLSVLEGLDLNYALVMDGSGARVDQLMILGARTVATPTAGRAAAAATPRPTPAEEAALAELGLDDEPEEEDTTEADQLEALEAASQTRPAPQPAGHPRPPEYPSSSFSPRLPMPASPPPSSPQPPTDP